MTDNQKAAYIIGKAAQALIEAIGMYSQNQKRLARGEAIAYPDNAFHDLIEEYGIHHNAMISLFHE